ncbi:hypothetical protein [Ethanoligenens sp.]|uniref:hypothetical protein n=1 Tax=Ethanoligenens sp. TaxID=2099655 RepID=UPI0039EC49F8
MGYWLLCAGCPAAFLFLSKVKAASLLSVSVRKAVVKGFASGNTTVSHVMYRIAWGIIV